MSQIRLAKFNEHLLIILLNGFTSSVLNCFLFNWDSLHGRLNNHFKAWNYKKKKKIKGYRKAVYRESKDKRCLLILDLLTLDFIKAINIIGQRKGFCRHITPESSCERKENIEIDILIISSNGDREIIQSIRIKSHKNEKVEAVQPVHMNIYQCS